MLVVLVSAAAPAAAAPAESGQGALALLVLLAAIAGWIGLRWLFRSRNVAQAERVVGESFVEFALAALANAARIDGRVHEMERKAMAAAMRDIAGADFNEARIGAAIADARLSKDQLVDYLRAKSDVFTRDQKALLLKSLVSLIVADGSFDEAEHSVLVDYTEAVGFDRQNAPDMLRSLSQDLAGGRIV